MVEDFINKEFRLCDLIERKKSVIYREVDLDKLIDTNYSIELLKENSNEKGNGEIY